MQHHKKTKIVCTLGPATSSVEMIYELIKAGMNVARINFSHGTHEECLKLIQAVRNAAIKAEKIVAVMQDLQGPKIRLGLLPESGVTVKKDEIIILSTGTEKYSEKDHKIFPVQYKELHQDVKKDDTILIEDGMIELTVTSVKGKEIVCKTVNSCTLKSHKGINVPTASISADPLTEKDLEDLKFGMENKVDFVALSFVRSAQDIKKIHKILKANNSKARVIAKIERHEAVENLEAIIHETDAVMVARGDLGVEIPAELVPIVQKKIISIANREGKPVIVATEVLQSMIENPRPTRAEISDAANGIYDHTDAIMLSNETAVGKYPVKAVQVLSRVAKSIEHELSKGKLLSPHITVNDIISDQICQNAADLAKDINAKYIIALTRTGYTAVQIAKTRVFNEIIAITPKGKTSRFLALVWGIDQVYIRHLHPRRYVTQVTAFLTEQKMVKKGDKVVIVANDPKTFRAITAITI
jgi:pyruvate kinase